MILIKYLNGKHIYYAENVKARNWRKLDDNVAYSMDTNWPDYPDSITNYKLSIQAALNKGKLQLVHINDFTHSQKVYFIKALETNAVFKKLVKKAFDTIPLYRRVICTTLPMVAIDLYSYDVAEAAMDRLIKQVACGDVQTSCVKAEALEKRVEALETDALIEIYMTPDSIKKALSEYCNQPVKKLKVTFKNDKIEHFSVFVERSL